MSIVHVCTSVKKKIMSLSYDVLFCIIHKLNKTTCVLDPFQTTFLMSHLSSITDIICIVNLSFSCITVSCRSEIIIIHNYNTYIYMVKYLVIQQVQRAYNQ